MTIAVRQMFAMCCLALAGCQTVPTAHVPVSELSAFEPLPASRRILSTVLLRWEVRDDVAEHCAQATGMGRERAYTTPPLACAIWSVARQECTIVTGRTTTHLALGHEVRHCFEGHFHR